MYKKSASEINSLSPHIEMLILDRQGVTRTLVNLLHFIHETCTKYFLLLLNPYHAEFLKWNNPS